MKQERADKMKTEPTLTAGLRRSLLVIAAVFQLRFYSKN